MKSHLNKPLLLILATSLLFGSLKLWSQSNDAPPHKEPRHKQLGKAYGFIIGQTFTLNKIKIEYPELKSEALLAEAQFNASPYGNAHEGIREEFATIISKQWPGEDWAEFERKFESQIINPLRDQSISSDQASVFIETVKKRANGDMNTDVRSILLSAVPEYTRNPAREVIEGLTEKFDSSLHPKAKGARFLISVPYSWKNKEGDRPNIVQVFQSKVGHGEVICTILVKQFPDQFVPSEEEIRSFYSEESLAELAPEGATVVRSSVVTLDGLPSGLLVSDIAAQRVDLQIRSRIIAFIVIQGGNMIQLQFMLGGAGNASQNLDSLEAKNLGLIKAIAGSFVALEKY